LPLTNGEVNFLIGNLKREVIAEKGFLHYLLKKCLKGLT